MIIYNWLELLKDLKLKGILHIGAHNCEEKELYKMINIDNVIWIDANSKNHEINNFLVSDKDDEEYLFNIANNSESSSVNKLKLHRDLYPDINYINSKIIKSKTINSIYNILNIDRDIYDVWYICTQGSELCALKGGIKEINNIKVIIIKVYNKEVYENCPIINDVDNFLIDYNFKRIISEFTKENYGFALYANKIFNINRY